jgi:hypothetical protein
VWCETMTKMKSWCEFLHTPRPFVDGLRWAYPVHYHSLWPSFLVRRYHISFARARQPGVLDDNRREGEGNIARVIELEAPVWEIVETQSGQMILDDQSRAITQPLQCFLVGKSKVEPLRRITSCWSSLPTGARGPSI